MRITRQQLRRLIKEQVEPDSPELQVILDQMENLSINDLRVIWRTVADVTRRKENELKADFKKGDRVAFADQSGNERTGTVTRRGGKFVMVTVDGFYGRPWKRRPSSLTKI